MAQSPQSRALNEVILEDDGSAGPACEDPLSYFHALPMELDRIGSGTFRQLIDIAQKQPQIPRHRLARTAPGGYAWGMSRSSRSSDQRR